MVEFLRDRRWDKRNRTNFYWVMLLVCINTIQFRSMLSLRRDEYLVILAQKMSMKTWQSSKFSCPVF